MSAPPTLQTSPHFTAFVQGTRITSGLLADVVTHAKDQLGSHSAADTVLIFRDATGEQVDVDLHGPLKKILQHLPVFASPEAAPGTDSDEAAPLRPGRPKLGVVPREVTLLPRHWDWLNDQPGGASVTLRKLVEDARRASLPADQARRAREACYRFMQATAGNLPRFEDASRALFAGQRSSFQQATRLWPADLRAYALALAAPAFITIPKTEQS
ncbi:MAG TPA: DUF2239 family protein [Prosthecobacter sp.]